MLAPTPQLLLALAAYAVMTLHFLFIGIVLFGGVVSLRFPRFFAIHIPAFSYALLIEAIRFPCLVTDIEKDLRLLAHLPNYQRGFIGHYIEPYVSALGLPPLIYSNMGYWTVGLNLVLYAWILRRHLRNRSLVTSSPAPSTQSPPESPLAMPPSASSAPGARAMFACLLLPTFLLGSGCRSDQPVPTTRPVARAATGSGTTSAPPAFPYRMLVIFAEEETDLRLDQQRRLLGPVMKLLERRHIRLIEVVGSDPLRDLLNVPPQGFHVLLVEQSGRPSFSAEKPITPEQLRIQLGADPEEASKPAAPPTDTARTQSPPRSPRPVSPSHPWR